MLQTDFKFDLRLMRNHPFFRMESWKDSDCICNLTVDGLAHDEVARFCWLALSFCLRMVQVVHGGIRVEFDLVWCSTRVQRVDVLNGAYRSSIEKEADQQYIVSYIKLLY